MKSSTPSRSAKASAFDATGDLALKALRVSESRYRRLFETAQYGILLLNADTAQIEDVNPYLIEMLGYSHTVFLGKKLWVVGSFADIAQSKAMFTLLQTQGYRYKRSVALILCDVDAFKAYNDCYGHQAGDECLKQVAAALRSCCRRPADMSARYGGEEFALILPDTGLAGATHIAEAALAAGIAIEHCTRAFACGTVCQRQLRRCRAAPGNGHERAATGCGSRSESVSGETSGAQSNGLHASRTGK